MKNILVVDDHPTVLEVMMARAQKVFADANIHRAGSFEQAEEVAQAGEQLDLVLLDLGLPGCPGMSALTRFRKIAPSVRVVIWSGNDDQGMVRAALDAGAQGYIPKTSKPDVIMAALHLIAAGSIYIPPQAIQGPAEAAKPYGLTERQLEVLGLLVHGHSNKDIAKRLGIAMDTVKQHVSAILTALGIASRSQAAHAVARLGIKLQ